MRAGQRTILVSELEDLRKRIIQNHISAGQKASGKTIRSLKIDIGEDYGELSGRGFFATLETGRKAGKIPYGFRLILERWANAKGIVPKNMNSFTFLVARKIARQGTLLHRLGGRTDIYSNEIPRTISNLTRRLGAEQLTEIRNIIINANKVYA